MPRPSRSTLYRHTGVALLRAAAAPLSSAPATWPDPADSAGCRDWLEQVWSQPDLAAAVRQASPSLGRAVDAIGSGRTTEAKTIRRATLSTVRYLLRSTGRPTPFGLFAGVAPVALGRTADVEWGEGHRATARVNTEWLAEVISDAENCPELLARLEVVVNDLAIRRGDRLEVPQGPNRVRIRYTRAVAAAEALARTPIRFHSLVQALAADFDAEAATVRTALTTLVRHGYLITNLRAPFTITDPFTHLLEQLDAAGAACLPATAALRAELDTVHTALRRHNDPDTEPAEARTLRAEVTECMRKLSAAGRTPLVADLTLDCRVAVPVQLTQEMERAATALLRLTRHPVGEAVWRDYHQAVLDRYGTGTLIPLGELLNPDAGLGYPATYPGSVYPAPPPGHAQRDGRLLGLAFEAVATGSREIVLTDELITELAGEELDPRFIPPHVELSARIHARSREALDRGDFRLAVAPARSAGTLTSRFTPLAAGSGLEQVYRDLPTATAGALRVQMSFAAVYPHAENVCRVPAYLDHVLPLGEHRPRGQDASVITVDDLAVTATRDRLHLVSLSRKQVVEPQLFHALAVDKQAPPIARFLTHLPRAFSAGWFQFDWGPHTGLAFLPQIRYGRTILAPAQWRLTSTDLPARAEQWPMALFRWRRRWDCPVAVELRDADRTLRLSLVQPAHLAVLQAHLARHGQAILTEATDAQEFGWLDGHAHELALPLVTTAPPAPNPLHGPLPVVCNDHGQLPGAPASRWLSVKLFTHPERINDLLIKALPELALQLDDPVHWWLRYRGPHESDHLRLRLAAAAQDYGRHTSVVGSWAQRMREKGLLSRLVLDTYVPEIGRYGDGPALAAAEAVFAADSAVVAATLAQQPEGEPDLALVVANMVALVTGFFSDQGEAMTWLADQPAATTPAPSRAVTERAIRWATTPGELMETFGWRAITPAWHDRADLLADYRQALPPQVNTAVVLESLMHLHHNRAVGIDPERERACRRLARQAARSWLARRTVGAR
ncbi:thiopeptide-type bacteriocin biosynthesis protein [Crossiella equi]|uniref:Thiopeptide-type bacteriocin biosynthesis protein n=1 Tax=Crossiella equi TaxID=130796 RepID=A0ABS5AMJ2_9PSEU|nr:lantibiotic dehydratase [Crossiella equi]MBP2477621.1 thiopeptide-type bacteriocin biosynthesis protein [Crossiella equi]